MTLTKVLIHFVVTLGVLIPGVALAGDPPKPPCPAGITCFDLTTATPPASATINGAIYSVPPTETSGTGLIDSFVRVQANGSEQGYNTSDYSSEPDLQFDEKSGSFTHDLLYSALLTNTVNVGGIDYIEFVLDVNQTSGGRYISLDQLKIYSGPDQATNTAAGDYDTATGQLGSLQPIYDLDAGGDKMVMLNYENYPGSGKLDMFLLIPKALFCNPGGSPNAPDPCVTAGPAADQTHVYLYSEFGTSAGFATDDGFEEWAHKLVGTFTPEPGIIALLLIGLAALGWMKRGKPTPSGAHTAMC